MCRWLCYTGSPVFADTLLFKPQYSLVEQSQHAQRSIYTVTDGDGFGRWSWYGSRPWPGVYHDTQPAWNDDNFQNLAAQIRSHTILAHVRATSGTAIQRTNCHPFRYQHWLFQHNGEIGGFDHLRRELQLANSGSETDGSWCAGWPCRSWPARARESCASGFAPRGSGIVDTFQAGCVS